MRFIRTISKFFFKLLAGILLFLGIPSSIFCILLMVNPNISTSMADRLIWLTLLLVVSVPITVVGGWMAWNVIQQDRQEALEREQEKNQYLQNVFFDLVRQTDGEITL